MRQLPAMAHLHNDRAVPAKAEHAEYAAKNSLVTGGIVIPGKSARIKRACRLGRRQVLIGPFPPILHRKIRKYSKYFRIFLSCLDEKTLAQNCFARKKKGFCVGRGEKRRNTGYVFRAFSTKTGAERSFLRCRIPILRALKLWNKCAERDIIFP